MKGVRIDKWLWAARFFRTRALAKQAVDKGWVRLGKERVKASREVEVGMQMEVRQGREWKVVDILALSDQRGPASAAAQLYCETPESCNRREQERALRKAERDGLALPQGRPPRDKRRQLGAMKRQRSE